MNRLVLAILAGVAAALGAGCSDDDPVRCDRGVTGVFHGQVLGPSGPVAARIWAAGLSTADQAVHAWSITDGQGRYEMCLPAGVYTLGCRLEEQSTELALGADGATLDPNAGASLELEGGRVRADFLLGRLEIELGVPEQRAGRPYECTITARSGGELHTTLFADEEERLLLDRLLPPGVVCLRFDSGGEVFWFPGTLDSLEADVLVIVAESTTVASRDLAAPARLSGGITGAWQHLTPDDPPSIVAYVAENEVGWSSRVAMDGSFVLQQSLPRPVRLAVQHGDVTRWLGGARYDEATLYAPDSGETIALDPIADLGLLCHHSGPSPDGVFRSKMLVLDAAGDTVVVGGTGCGGGTAAAVCNLEPGDYYLYVWPTVCTPRQTWLPQWYDGAEDREHAVPVSVSPEHPVIEVTVALIEGGSIAGRVTREGGRFPHHCLARLYPAADSVASAVDLPVDAVTGEFVIEGLADGSYKLALWTLDHVRRWYPGVLGHAAAEELVIEDHGRIEGLEWTDAY